MANDPEKLEKLAKINGYHVSLFAYYLDKLKATADGDGSLLDHSVIMLGSGLGNPDVHDHLNLPDRRRGRSRQSQGRPSHQVRGADGSGKRAL